MKFRNEEKNKMASVMAVLEEREAADIFRQKLADKSGVSKTIIVRIVNGNNTFEFCQYFDSTDCRNNEYVVESSEILIDGTPIVAGSLFGECLGPGVKKVVRYHEYLLVFFA